MTLFSDQYCSCNRSQETVW